MSNKNTSTNNIKKPENESKKKETTMKKTDDKKPVTKKSAATKPTTTKKPTASKPAAKKIDLKKTTAAKPVVKKVNLKKPVTPKTKQLPSTVNQIAGVFDPIEFDKLNASISKLAAANNKLTPEEKSFAIEIIQEWNESVVKAIDEKIVEGNDILASLNPNNNISNEISDERLGAVAGQISAETAKLYNDYAIARDNVLEITREKPVWDQVRDLNETAEEFITRQAKEQAEYTKWELKSAKARKNCQWALYNLKKELETKEEIQELIKRIKSFTRKSSTFKKQCEDKARLAKINITISDNTVREALKDIISFDI